MSDVEYQLLTAADKLQIARDTLRAAEMDHFRVSLDPASGGGEARLQELGDRVERLRIEVNEFEASQEDGS